MPPSGGAVAPAWNAPVNYQANLTKDVAGIAPLASTWNGAQNGVQVSQVNSQISTSSGVLSGFEHFLGSAGGEAGHLLESGAKWLGHTAVSAVEAPIKLGQGLAHMGLDSYDTFVNQNQVSELSTRMDNLNAQYKSGSINASEYRRELNLWQEDNNSLSAQISDNMKSLSKDGKATAAPAINTASDILTILTGGLSAPVVDLGTQSAAKFLQSGLVDAAMSPAEDAITKIAANKAVFDALPEATQRAVSSAFTETVTTADSSLTAAQIARSVATNALLKYPLAYSSLSGTGLQVYQELQNAKYGSAVNTMAFNAALLLSGGPIGQALKYGGKALEGLSVRTFGNTSFLDELSKRIGNGEAGGLFGAIKDDPEAVKAFQALEATNMGAVGNKPATAAFRVIDGLSQSWGDLSNMSHDDFVKQVMNWHTAQQLTDEYAKTTGKTGLAVGRWTKFDGQRVADSLISGSHDVQAPPPQTITAAGSMDGIVSDETANAANETTQNALNNNPVATGNATPTPQAAQTVAQLTGTDSKESILQRWDTLKAQNPNAAFANNENLDKQIKGIISRNWNKPDAMKTAITSISAQFGEKDIPSALSDKLGKMGYVVIKPTTLEAPFKEGEGPIKSAFANGNDESFIKAVRPLPVLESVGNQLVRMGLSPNAAPQRVYDVFNANFAEELAKTDLSYRGLSGEDLKDQADIVSKKLANFVHNMPNSLVHPPVTDYRQLTNKEIATALDMTHSEAAQVSDAIMQSMIKVPLSVKGLGNKLLDLNYKLPLTGKYLRYQGAIRYAWNPVFKMKLAAKGEILSQLESNGQWPTITGVNAIMKTIFPEQYGRIADIEASLKSRNMFEAGYSAEAADETAAGYRSMAGQDTAERSGLVASQRRATSALIGTMADKAGMAPKDFIDQYPQETRDVIQAIVHYDPRSNFLNSPMARTLNFAFFPFRFNLKVSQIVARNIAHQSAITQFAVIKGFMNASNFLKSDAGQAWYSQNSDIIGLLKYFSPVATLSEVASALGQKPQSVSQYGELGGLPFGWIPTVLSSQGLIDTNQPYVNPKTGVVAKDYVPVSLRGRLESAIEDFIGQLFTYPGTTVGLPSKTSITANIAKGITGGQTSDFSVTTPTNLTPQQQQFQQAVQKLNGTLQEAKQADNPVVNGQPTNVPQTPTPLTVPQPKTTATSSKKKKADETPELLPGQSSLGQES